MLPGLRSQKLYLLLKTYQKLYRILHSIRYDVFDSKASIEKLRTILIIYRFQKQNKFDGFHVLSEDKGNEGKGKWK